MFSLREFLMQGFKDAIGKQEDYKIIFNATGWQDKGVLTLEDLEEINNLLNPPVEENIDEPIDTEVE